MQKSFVACSLLIKKTIKKATATPMLKKSQTLSFIPPPFINSLSLIAFHDYLCFQSSFSLAPQSSFGKTYTVKINQYFERISLEGLYNTKFCFSSYISIKQQKVAVKNQNIKKFSAI